MLIEKEQTNIKMKFWNKTATFDFETTKVDNKNEQAQVYVWKIIFHLSQLPKIKTKKYHLAIDLKKEVVSLTDISISSFIDCCCELFSGWKLYSANGSNFDNHFIIGELINRGGEQIINNDKIKINVKEVNKYPFNFEAIITEHKNIKYLKFYSNKKIRLRKWKWKNKNRIGYHIYELGTIEFFDALLLFNGSIQAKGKELIKHYQNQGLDKKQCEEWFSKKELKSNYNRKNLYKNYEEFINDGNENEYLFNDCFILFKYLELMSTIFPYQKWKMTSAATAYDELLRFIGQQEILSENIKTIMAENNFKKYYKNKKVMTPLMLGKKWIQEHTPTDWFNDKFNDQKITNYEMLKLGYRGGLTIVNESEKGIFNENIYGYDINSSYPSVMNSNELIPIGRPLPIEKQIEGKWFLYRIDIINEIENIFGLPFMLDYSNYYGKKGSAFYLKKLKQKMFFIIDSHEYLRFLKYYHPKSNDIKVTILFAFNAIRAKEIFGSFIDHYYQLKEQSTINNNIPLKNTCKLMLNSTYGKFGSKPEQESIYIINGKTEKITTLMKKFYLPIAIAITSLARMKLVDAIDNQYQHMICGDTDSIFVKKEFNTNHMQIDPHKLGAWKCEYENICGVARWTKKYLFKTQKDIYQDNKLIFKKYENIKVNYAGINLKKDIDIYDAIKLGICNQDGEWNVDAYSYEKNLTFKDIITGTTIKKQLTNLKNLMSANLIEIEKKIMPIWKVKQHPEAVYCKKDWLKEIKRIKQKEF